MKILITGATGFIGRPLTRSLVADGHEVIALTRNRIRAAAALGSGVTTALWDGRTTKGWEYLVDGLYAVINLAGENIAAVRWSDVKKRRITSSRLFAIEALAEAIRAAKRKPRVVLQASAVAIYGSRGVETLHEDSAPGTGFLASFNQEWEDAAKVFVELGVRTVWLRTGLVIGAGGGLLKTLSLPFKFFVGGPLGDGSQFMPWIHLADEVAAIRFLLTHDNAAGPFNLTGPNPLPGKVFLAQLGKALQRPSWLPLPASLARLLMGEMADELVLVSSRAMPRRLQEAGFTFKYTDLAEALDDIHKK